MSDKQTPRPALTESNSHVHLQMKGRAVIGWHKIATVSIVPAFAEGFADDARTFTADEYAHALPSFAFLVWVAWTRELNI